MGTVVERKAGKNSSLPSVQGFKSLTFVKDVVPPNAKCVLIQHSTGTGQVITQGIYGWGMQGTDEPYPRAQNKLTVWIRSHQCCLQAAEAQHSLTFSVAMEVQGVELNYQPAEFPAQLLAPRMQRFQCVQIKATKNILYFKELQLL